MSIISTRHSGIVVPEKRCEICDRSWYRLVQDHDHATGKNRGMICDSCNYDFLGSIENFKGRQKKFRWDHVYGSSAGVITFKREILNKLVDYLDHYDSTFIVMLEDGIKVIKTPFVKQCLHGQNEREQFKNRRRF